MLITIIIVILIGINKLINSGAASRCGQSRSPLGGLVAEEIGETRAANRPLSHRQTPPVMKELCVQLVIGMNTLNNCGAASHCSQLHSPLGGLAAEEGGEVEESSK